MARKKHIHKYVKRQLSHATVWACALPDCTHYMPPHLTDLVNNKLSLCNNCGDQFIMTPKAMEMSRPECESCRIGETKEAPMSEALVAAIKKPSKVVITDKLIDEFIFGETPK